MAVKILARKKIVSFIYINTKISNILLIVQRTLKVLRRHSHTYYTHLHYNMTYLIIFRVARVYLVL